MGISRRNVSAICLSAQWKRDCESDSSEADSAFLFSVFFLSEKICSSFQNTLTLLTKTFEASTSPLVKTGVMGHMQLNQSCISLFWFRNFNAAEL